MWPPQVLAEELQEGGLSPNVAAGCAVRTAEGWKSALGGETDRLFDLASLTKPMTAVAIALSGLDRTATLGSLCPELRGTASEDISLELLASHRAGLMAHIPVYHPLALGQSIDVGAALRTAANARREDAAGRPRAPETGFAPVYSDLGYALAGLALARHVDARDAGQAIERLVVSKLGLLESLGTARGLEERGIDVVGRSAPTEDVAWRGGLVQGRVHDENAWALTGTGGSGHAGMFGTVGAVLRFAEAVMDGLVGEGPFAASSLGWLVAERPGGTLRAGFDGKSIEGSSAGSLFGARSFGHLGFTGTSVWMDPDAHVAAVLLTNRVYPSRTRADRAIKRERPRAHDALHAYARTLRV